MAIKETMDTGRRTREYNSFWQNMVQIKGALVDDDAAKKILEIKFRDVGWMRSDSKTTNTAIDLVNKALNIIEKYPSQYEVMRKMMEDVGLSCKLPNLDGKYTLKFRNISCVSSLQMLSGKLLR